MKYHMSIITKRIAKKLSYDTFSHDDKPMIQDEKEEEKHIVKI